MVSKRLICLMCLVLITALAGNVWAGTSNWTDGSGDHLWSTPANWDNFPTSADWAKVKNGSPGATVVSAGAVALKVHVGYDEGSVLTVDGGTLTMPNLGNSDLLLGKSGGSGTLNMIDGTITCVDLEVGGGNPGTINMTGGTINVGDDFTIPETAGITAEVNLDAGTIFVGGVLTMGATGSIDITNGTLVVDGDVETTIDTYISNGWITAHDGTGIVVCDTTVNPGKTTVTATDPIIPPTKATNPTPANGADASIGTTLSWTRGAAAVSHDVYFGTTSPGTFQGNQTADTFSPGVLNLDTVYYWRIDEKNSLGMATGDVWSFTAKILPSEVVIEPTGTSDDSTLIQTSLDGLLAGDTLRLDGHFVIGRTIYLPSNFIWTLNGSLTLGDNAVLDDVGWVAPGIDATRSTGITEKPGGATNIDMSGGAYYGNSANNSSNRFINFVSVTNSNFHDMVITDGSDDNFTLGPGCNNNECRNLIGSFAGGNALTDKGDHNYWYDCVAEDCASDGWTPKCRYSEFYRCIARRNEGPGFGMFCRIDGSGDPVDLGEAIEGNKFYACESYENNAAGFSFNVSSTSGEGGSITNNYVEAVCYNNASSGVRFRNKMPNSIVADNEINLLCYGNRGESKSGPLSGSAGGLGTDASVDYPVTGITGTLVSFDNIQWDVNTGAAYDCDITVYHPVAENAPVLKTGDASNIITVIDFDCLDTLDHWCMQAYCDLLPCAGEADFDCDRNVDFDDLVYMAGVWLTDDSVADIAKPEDNKVSLPDLSVLSKEWLDESEFERFEDQPNLLFIMTDQQRYDALSRAGNTVLLTPNMDRIANEGVWFKNAHTQCAVCTPTRVSMLTGMTLANHGVYKNSLNMSLEMDGLMSTPTFDDVLHENGYRCEYYGKWHVPTFAARCYSNRAGMAGKSKTELGPGHRAQYLTWLEPLFPENDNPPVGDQLIDTYSDRPYEPYLLDYTDYLRRTGDPNWDKHDASQSEIHGVTTIPSEYYMPVHEAEETIHAIERLKDQRFSITCSFHNPHPPYIAAADYAALYPWQDMVPPVSINDDMSDSPYSNSAWEMYSDPDGVKQFITEYYGMVKQIDDEVGEILAKLDEHGLTDNTMVIFVSDHGEMLGSHGMKGKFNFYEESSHVPMMIRFPGRIEPGTTVTAPVSNMDLFATILDYMDMPDHSSDGVSLRGLIEGTVNEEETYTVTEWLSSLSSKPSHLVVKNGWKYMRPMDGYNADMGLYNLNNDPHELANLVADQAGLDAHAAKVAELEACYQEWIQRTGQ